MQYFKTNSSHPYSAQEPSLSSFCQPDLLRAFQITNGALGKSSSKLTTPIVLSNRAQGAQTHEYLPLGDGRVNPLSASIRARQFVYSYFSLISIEKTRISSCRSTFPTIPASTNTKRFIFLAARSLAILEKSAKYLLISSAYEEDFKLLSFT